MLTDVPAFLGGLALMTVAADRFVLGAARLSVALRVSPVLIGAVVIGFGTSAPEFVVTILATLDGSQDLAFGNIVGSNTANALLVLGVAGLFSPLFVAPATLRRELPLMVVGVVVLAAVTVDGRVSTLDAVVLLVAAAGAMAVVVLTALRDRAAVATLEAEVAEYGGPGSPVARSALLAGAGLVGTLVGAQLVVTGAVGIARTLGVSEAVIGLTVVAIGTSLPELVTAVASARRRETDLVVGNVLGSNLFNSLPVAGVAGLLATVQLDAAFRLGSAVMVAACVLAALLLRSGRRLSRVEAAALLTTFVAVTVGVVLA